MLLYTSLGLVYDLLNAVAQSPDYWTILNTAFGSSYNSNLAATLQQQWQARNFSTLPPIEILGSEVLGNAIGGYTAGNNTIHLADTFVASATPEALSAVLLEEIGHYVDAQINGTDIQGNEGELFSLLVRGIAPTATDPNRLQTANNQAGIIIGGQPVAIEQVFSTASNYSVGRNPTSVVVGDFNDDGKLDLAVANSGSNSVSILLGDDTGGFSPASNYSVGRNPTSVAVGDFNGDGKLDLATANPGSVSISMLLGDGAGSFSPASNYSVGRDPTSVAVGDFNGDGKLDLATANLADNSLSVLLGDGAGGFNAASNYSVGSRPTSVAVGDFNGDGKPDLATTNLGNDSLSVLLGDGAGGFNTASNYSVGSRPTSVAVGDFNGDGKLDLAAANLGDNSLSVLLGDGAGGFNAASNYSVGSRPTSLALGDFNGDGKLDLTTSNYSSNSTSILLGDGIGGFSTARNYSAGGDPDSVAVGDFNGDGKLDLATANLLSNSVSILQNSTPKITIAAGTAPIEGGIAGTYIISLDTIAPTGGLVVNFNTTGSTATLITDYTLSAGDNITNLTATSFTIAAGQTTGTLNLTAASDAVNDPGETVQINLVGGGDYILGQNSTALLTPATNYSVGHSPNSVAVGDFNGDGKLDLATANRDGGSVSILLGDGAGGFSTASNYSVGHSPSSVAVGDLNSDGKLDLAIADVGLSTLLGDGSGGFGSPTYYNTSPEGKPRPAYAVAVGDFNGDGKLDFATANPYQYNNSVSILLGDGAGGVSTASYYYSVPDYPFSVAVGDFNGDGKLDLATANYASKCISVLLGDGVGGVSTSSCYSVPACPVSVAVGDFSGDGKLDLATANLEDMGNQMGVSILLGDGAGGFGTAINSIGNSSWSVAVGDFNDDGKLDLATADGSNSASVLLGDGTGEFSTAGDYSVGNAPYSNPYSVAVGDFNGDGKLDLTTANYSDDSTSVLLGADPSATLTIATTNEEDLDALSVLANGDLLISTEGAFSVPELSGKGDDIVCFRPTSLSDTTTGSRSLYFAGDNFDLSAVGENADALGLQQETLYLSTLDDFTVPNLRGVFGFTPTAIAANGTISSGQYGTVTFSDGNFYGLGLDDATAVGFCF